MKVTIEEREMGQAILEYAQKHKICPPDWSDVFIQLEGEA